MEYQSQKPIQKQFKKDELLNFPSQTKKQETEENTIEKKDSNLHNNPFLKLNNEIKPQSIQDVLNSLSKQKILKETTKEIIVLNDNFTRINNIKKSPDFRHHSPEFKKNLSYIQKELEKKPHTLLGMEKLTLNKQDYCNLVSYKSEMYQYLPIYIKNNLDVSETAIQSNPFNYQFIPDKYKVNREMILKHLNLTDYKILPYINNELKNDNEIKNVLQSFNLKNSDVRNNKVS